MERWRAQAQEEDWVEDDDGLGWEGEEVSEPTLWKGDGNGHAPEPEAWRGDVGNGHIPAPEPSTTWTSGVNGRDWSRADEPSPAQPAAPAFASASAATDVAPLPDVEAETGDAYDLDDDWDEPVGRPWGAPAEPAPRPAAPAPTRAPNSRRKLHPVLLLAIYAAAGVGLVVLASTVLLGGSADAPAEPPPATRSTPEPVQTPEPTPEATGSVVDDPAAAEAARVAAAKAEQEFRRDRTRALAARRDAVDRARAAERRAERARERRAREARARRNRQNNSNNGGSGGNNAGSGSGSVATPRAPAVPRSPRHRRRWRRRRGGGARRRWRRRRRVDGL